MSDLISRQAAINALERTKRIASYELHGGEVLRTFNVVLNSLINIMSLLPPANNSEIPNSSDTISRAKAIEALGTITMYKGMIPFNTAMERIKRMPSAELGANLAEVGTDCISRQAVLDALNNIEIPRNASWYQYYQQALTAVDKLPPAQPERKKGKWHRRFYPQIEMMVCSECQEEFSYDAETGIRDYNYCPNCGADMREVTT